ncbi:SNF1-related protein kinase regulatory subunit gamma-like PV42a [Elaeis guineensis]|uniref:SNF1-related protein kinase regulatory subunit gamma-like PV42a n=1 Tax=Elaeis guineensis var. tenera TaxID=51953 RepID=A0A6I9RJN5_ELAGV|nr:SNF1-related protein kinase regulatory subunit gamma-like PV42a [Elaeis guineensis]
MEKSALEEKQPKEVVEEDVMELAEERKKKPRKGPCGWLRERKVRELVLGKRRLVEVPYTATLAHTLNALVANRVAAVPVAAPPGHWIGAGGSMILESDKATGAIRKHYIGMVTMVDILAHIAEEDHAAHDYSAPAPDLDVRMAVPVSSIIGHSLEGLSLWTLNPNTSILDCMESFSKGVHRALVPLESHADHVIAVELVEASPGYRMLTQMDLLAFLKENSQELKDALSCGVQGLGAINENVFAVTEYTTVIEAIRSMRSASLNAVPVVESPGDGQPLQDGRGKRLADTFSATDLRGCPIGLLQSWLSMSIMEFKGRVSMRETAAPHPHHDTKLAPRKLITCDPGTNLAQVMEEMVEGDVHRVWVVDRDGLLMGLVSLTDMLRVIRESVLLADRELVSEVVPDHGPT